MPRFAVCSNPKCSYDGPAKESPGWNPQRDAAPCPLCKSALVFHCPACFLSIQRQPDPRDPRCSRCNARLKAPDSPAKESSS
jgi:hypothetical protein